MNVLEYMKDHVLMMDGGMGTLLQAKGLPAPEYQMIAEEGPPHLRVFTMAVYSQGEEIGRGIGNSKKKAEQAAAGMALEGVKE